MDVILYNKIQKVQNEVNASKVAEKRTTIAGKDIPIAERLGFISGITGELVLTNAGKATDYVMIHGTLSNVVIGKAFIFGDYGVAFYDIDKRFISGFNGIGAEIYTPQLFELTAPSNAKYVRWSLLMEQSRIPEDFSVEIISKFDEKNENLKVDWTQVPVSSSNGYISGVDGTYMNSNAGRCSDYFEIPSSIGGTVKGKAFISGTVGVAFYTASRKFISGYTDDTASGYVTEFEIPIPVTAKYMRWSQVYTSEAALDNFGVSFSIPQQVYIEDLSDRVRVIDNYALHANDGSLESTSSWVTTDYIDVSFAKGFSIQTTLYNNEGIAFYDASKNYVDGITGNTAGRTSSLNAVTLRMDVPEGISYIRSTIYKDGNYSEPHDFCPLLMSVNRETEKIVSFAEESMNNGSHYVLILGDSYSKQGLWVDGLKSGLNVAEVVNLGVTGATIKDQQADRTQYPYTDRPTSSGTGNQNTLGSQVQKLKRLIDGSDLDTGEVQIYADHSPDIVIIEGGMNDSPDNSTKENAYPQQFITQVNNVYYKNASGVVTQGTYHIKPDVETVDRTSFAGSYRHIVEEILTLFPDAQIFITTASKFNYFVDNPQGYDTIAAQQIKCARYCAATVIDWNGEGNINNITDCPKGSGTQADPYTVYGGTKNTSDGLHPNERGGRTYGRLAANVIKQRFASIGKNG